MSAVRADRLVELLAGRELDAILVTNQVNLRYLTGFTGTNGAALVGPRARTFITDFRYVEQAEREVPDFDRVRGERDLVGEVAERLEGRIGFEDQHLSVRHHARLEELASDAVELVPAGGLVERIRAVKDAEELAAIREAAKLVDGVFEHLRERGLAGRMESEVAVDLEREMRERGADGPAFPPIVAAGAQGALPHAIPRGECIAENTLVVVDMGARLDGYCSDCTRTLATGELDGHAAEVYELVLRAQEAALTQVRAGAGQRALDGVAREIIDAAGYGERFGHGLGHGVGLEVHEEPRLARTADGTLEPGNVVTVEPGIYLPGELGVRIEDLVVVTGDGHEVLSRFPKSLLMLQASVT